MCGRFANHLESLDEWSDILQAPWPEGAVTGFNISPSQVIPAFTAEGGKAMRWGLIPPWSDEPASKYSTFNARLESIASKPAFRHSWREGQRCLIPALGFYEWRSEAGVKQPYFVRTRSGAPLVMGGVWEPGRDGGAIPASCSIITRPADTPAMERLHARMPLMILRSAAVDWLRAAPTEIDQLAATLTRPDLRVYAVDRKVNSSRAEGSELTRPLDEPPSA